MPSVNAEILNVQEVVPVAALNVEPLSVDTSTSETVFASDAVPARVLDFVGDVVVIADDGARESILNVRVADAVLPPESCTVTIVECEPCDNALVVKDQLVVPVAVRLEPVSIV